jgi:hypothetical protein
MARLLCDANGDKGEARYGPEVTCLRYFVGGATALLYIEDQLHYNRKTVHHLVKGTDFALECLHLTSAPSS